jgi:protein-S-isoprenylcysteine O-methyltransferase Ste14
MAPLAYLAAAVTVLVATFFGLRLVRREYLRYGKLSVPASALQVAVFALHGALTWVALTATSWPELPGNLAHKTVGIGIGTIGLGLVVAAFCTFGSMARVVGRRVDELRRTGIYRRSRNPQLVGYGLFLAAFVVLWPSWQTVAALVVYGGIARSMVLAEEDHLHRVHGDLYNEYCARVPRYIGRPRRRFPL